METQKIPFIIYAEGTPNPESMKFVANKILLAEGATAEYKTIAETGQAPLPQKLFEFPFTKQVFISANYITLTKHAFVSWDDILMETRVFLTEYLNAGKPIILEVPQKEVAVDNTFTATKTVFTEHASPQNEIEEKIVDVLEQYIRPAVEQDGGLITFKSFVDGVVTVQLKGACSGCPSSTVTLKAGIEGLLKRLLPEAVKEVVSEAV